MEEFISKSEKKREAEALQKVGIELTHLPLSKLDKLPLPFNLRQAIIEAKSIKSHGAIRRQAQLIGKLMRQSDTEEILAAYHDLMLNEKAQTASFHSVEQWRARLIDEDKLALTEFINLCPQVDTQALRQLIKKAKDEKARDVSLGAAKALFRFLKAYLV